MENMIQFKTGNQLTITGFPTKEKVYPLSTTEKANFIYKNFKEKMPNLYAQIMKGKK